MQQVDRLSARDVTTITASVSGQMQVGSLDTSGAIVAQGGITTNDAFSGVSASLLETLVANAVEAKLESAKKQEAAMRAHAVQRNAEGVSDLLRRSP
eukprot:4181757-Pyramimonas_sp.AAC.1